MYRKTKLMILVNVLLSLLFVVASLEVRSSVESWLSVSDRYGIDRPNLYAVTDVNPLWISLEVTEPLPIGPLAHIDIPNYPFYIFWVAIVVNVYFILRMQKKAKSSK
jgi:hypothetical protein